MKIWVKATVKDGENTQCLTLKVEGNGEEAELEIVFGKMPIQFAEETKPQAAVQKGEKPTVVEEAQAEDEEVPLTTEELGAAFDEEPVEQEEEPSISEEPVADESTSLVEEVVSILEDHAGDYTPVEPAEGNNEKPSESEETAAVNITSVENVEHQEEIILEVPATASDAKRAEFMQIPHRSTNFDDLILRIAEWFELGKRTSYFVAVIKAATQCNPINWSNIEAILKNNGVQWGSYDKIWTSKQVTKKFIEINVDGTFMDLIKELAENKDFDFSGQAITPEQDINEAQPVIEEAQEEEELDAQEEQPVIEPSHEKNEQDTHEERPSNEQVEPEENSKSEESPISEEPAATEGTTAKKGKLEEIAEKSRDFDDFLKNITTWLELGKRSSYFVEVIKAAAQVKKINWSSIEAILEQNGTYWGASDKIWTSKQVSNKFQEIKRDVSIMKLIKEIVGYQDFDFAAHKTSAEPDIRQDQDCAAKEPLTDQEPVLETEETVNEASDGSEQPDTATSTRVRMNCMHEIPEFEEALGRIDKTQPLTERVQYVLDVMGLQNQNSEDSQLFLQIANAAVESKELLELDVLATDSAQKKIQENCLATILSVAEISKENATIARMKMAAFIHNFAKKHWHAANSIKLLHFLKDLQQVVSD